MIESGKEKDRHIWIFDRGREREKETESKAKKERDRKKRMDGKKSDTQWAAFVIIGRKNKLWIRLITCKYSKYAEEIVNKKCLYVQ